VPFLLICSTPRRRANPRAAPMPSSGKAGVHSRLRPPSAAAESFRAATGSRSDPAVRTTATFFVFVYTLLLLALENCHLAHSPLPRPRWQRLRPRHSRITTPQAISLLRADLWTSALGPQNKNGFVARNQRATRPFLIQNNLQSAVLYASG
jgi:hypothetical protein